MTSRPFYDDCTLFEYSYRSGERKGKHAHDAAYICVVVGGRYEDVNREGGRALGIGSVITYRADSPHASTMGPRGCCVFHLELRPPLDVIELSAAEYERLAVPMLRLWTCDTAEDPDAALSVDAELAEIRCLLDRSSNATAAPSALLDRTRERLTDDLDTPCSLHDLAAEADLDPSHLARSFRRQFGMSMGEYQRRLRIARAARLLGDSQEPIASIALRLGYSDQSHLTRLFHRTVGVTPSRFRRLTTR